MAAAVREDGALTALVEALLPAQARDEASAAVEAPASTAVFVCIACRRPAPDGATGETVLEQPGAGFAEALAVALADDADIAVVPMECLAVCKRPCTVAFAANGKWSYMIGDIDPNAHLDEVAASARAYAASRTGIVAWSGRPPCFRKGVLGRVPPATFRPERSTP